MKTQLYLSAFFLVFLSSFNLHSNDLGTKGLINIPSARMRLDGDWSASVSRQPLIDIYAIGYQATPWLETIFRYSAFRYGFYDRSYEVKARLIKERDYFPQVSIGIADVLGTGVFSSEYIVATKAVGNLDVTLGLGWGRLAGNGKFTNPLTLISDGFSHRDKEFGKGGEVEFDSFFRGEQVSAFGGVAYSIPKYNLKFLVEYNPDQYIREQNTGFLQEKSLSPISYGAEWEPIRGLTVGGSFQFGQEFALSFESVINSKQKIPNYPSLGFISAFDQKDSKSGKPNSQFVSWFGRIQHDFRQSGLELLEVYRDSESANISIVFRNFNYPSPKKAVAQAASITSVHLPKSYTGLNLIINENGVQPITIKLGRGLGGGDWLKSTSESSFSEQVRLLPGRELKAPTVKARYKYPFFSWSADLATRFQLFDPDDPLRHQLALKINLDTHIGKGWDLRATYVQDIFNNFDSITRSSNSVLPHVRSDISLYLKDGASGIDALYANTRGNLASNIYYRGYAGILEEMYSGVGGELLYQPFSSRLAFGLSANWVKQRDYNKRFDHLDYQSATAFASAYWAAPLYNYDIGVHAGRFLAKDLGVKLELRRTFDNGWMAGVWATLTNVPFEEFGEGSFDKGLFFKIPLHGLLRKNTRSSYNTAIRSIQRDGGQMLENYTGTMWWDLRNVRYDAFDDE